MTFIFLQGWILCEQIEKVIQLQYYPLHKPPTREEIIALTQAAKEAAMVGNHERTEIYRQLGVSIIDVARAIGTSRDWEYTEFLITENPQLFPKVDARKNRAYFQI